MYDLAPKNLKKLFHVKIVSNPECSCILCWKALQDYCVHLGMPEIPENDGKEYFVPVEWFEANMKKGCPHEGPQKGNKILRSAYVRE